MDGWFGMGWDEREVVVVGLEIGGQPVLPTTRAERTKERETKTQRETHSPVRYSLREGQKKGSCSRPTRVVRPLCCAGVCVCKGRERQSTEARELAGADCRVGHTQMVANTSENRIRLIVRDG